MQSVINKYRRYNWVAVTFLVVLHMTETILCQTSHHYLWHLPVHWGGTIIRVMICQLSTDHVSLFLLLSKHFLHTATRHFSPTWQNSSYVLNSSYGLNFVDNFSTLTMMSVRGSLSQFSGLISIHDICI